MKYHKYTLIGFAPPKGYRHLRCGDIFQADDFVWWGSRNELVSLSPDWAYQIGVKVIIDQHQFEDSFVRKIE